MSSSSITETLIVPTILTGITAIINYSLKLPQDYIIRDLAITFGSSLADEVFYNYLIDNVITDNSFTTEMINTLGKPVTYAALSHVGRMFVQKEYSRNLTYAIAENSILYMASDYVSIPFQLSI